MVVVCSSASHTAAADGLLPAVTGSLPHSHLDSASGVVVVCSSASHTAAVDGLLPAVTGSLPQSRQKVLEHRRNQRIRISTMVKLPLGRFSVGMVKTVN